jgi:hypothetical protein
MGCKKFGTNVLHKSRKGKEKFRVISQTNYHIFLKKMDMRRKYFMQQKAGGVKGKFTLSCGACGFRQMNERDEIFAGIYWRTPAD